MIAPVLAACAAFVAAPTLDAVIGVESGGNELAIHVNDGANPPPPRSRAEAVQDAKQLIAEGYSVDLGLMQVNSRNLPALGVTVEQMFEPCANIHAGASILSDAYGRAMRQAHEGQDALKVALSYYNTGSATRGFENGYVARYFVDGSPVAIRRWAGPTGRFKVTTNPYQADTDVGVPADYLRSVADQK